MPLARGSYLSGNVNPAFTLAKVQAAASVIGRNEMVLDAHRSSGGSVGRPGLQPFCCPGAFAERNRLHFRDCGM